MPDERDDEPKDRRAIHRGVEEIDIETGRSLGSPVEEGAGVKPDEDEETGAGEPPA